MKSKYFSLKIDNQGRITQLCKLCKKYESPTITNNQPERISMGLLSHLKRTHKIKKGLLC